MDSYLLPQEATINIVLITHSLGSFRSVHPSISISSFLLFPSSTERVQFAACLLFFLPFFPFSFDPVKGLVGQHPFSSQPTIPLALPPFHLLLISITVS